MFIQIDYVFSITQSGKVSGDFVVMGPGLDYGTPTPKIMAAKELFLSY